MDHQHDNREEGSCDSPSMAPSHYFNLASSSIRQSFDSFSKLPVLFHHHIMDDPSAASAVRGLRSSARTNNGGIILVMFVVSSIIVLFFLVYRHISKFHTKVPSSAVKLDRGTFAPLLQQEEASDNNDTATSSTTTNSNTNIERVHVIILVHGWLGCPQDLAYIHHAIQRQAALAMEEQERNSGSVMEPIVVHTCVANRNRTNDGIQAGADRIAVEANGVLEDVMAKYHDESLQEITLSILGYSLGGLYARYALPKIIPSTSILSSQNDDNHHHHHHQPLQQLPEITPKLFCTMATPHLGSSRGHTFFYMPSLVEQSISKVVPTGRDLFHHTPLIEQTITDPKWIEPLLRFEKRLLYTNAFGMDIMVPTSTAAFLSKHSNAEHVHVTNHAHPYIALVVETRAHHDLLLGASSLQDIGMAQRLDAMGWTKVFVDYTNSYRPVSHTPTTTGGAPDDKISYRSSELLSEFHPRKRRRFFLPIGHDLMAVNSKNVFYSYAMRKGRPLVDQMATDFIHDIVHGPIVSRI